MSDQSYEKSQLGKVEAVEADLAQHIMQAAEIMRSFGVPDPGYICSAAVMGILVRTLATYFEAAGMDKEASQERAKKLMEPVANAADDAYWEAKRLAQKDRHVFPPISLN